MSTFCINFKCTRKKYFFIEKAIFHKVLKLAEETIKPLQRKKTLKVNKTLEKLQ